VWDVATDDRAFGEHATRCAITVGDRRHLDDEAFDPDLNLERRVVEIQRTPSLDARLDGLEEKPAQSNESPGSAERPPVQVDARVARLNWQ
jgi:hypothetical protein